MTCAGLCWTDGRECYGRGWMGIRTESLEDEDEVEDVGERSCAPSRGWRISQACLSGMEDDATGGSRDAGRRGRKSKYIERLEAVIVIPAWAVSGT